MSNPPPHYPIYFSFSFFLFFVLSVCSRCTGFVSPIFVLLGAPNVKSLFAYQKNYTIGILFLGKSKFFIVDR